MKKVVIDWLNGLITENTTKAELDKIEFAKKCVRDYKEKEPKKKVAFAPPSIEEIAEYIRLKGYKVDCNKFYEYYTTAEWKDKNGKDVKNWKLKLLMWENSGNNRNATVDKNTFIHNNYTDNQIKGLITNLDDVEV